MCRSIKRLRVRDQVATEAEIREAARQFVRKISGYTSPAPRNAEAFEDAVTEVSLASQRVLERITKPTRA